MSDALDHEARAEIAEVLVRYATGIDLRDWDLFASCFSEDSVCDYGDIGVWTGPGEITSWMEQAHAGCGRTLHRITNIAIVRNGSFVASRCYVDAVVMGPDNSTGVRAVGFYDDELTSTEDGWKIHRRRFTPVLLQAVDTIG